MTDAKKIDANPSKEFFISMITRDIDLSSCVLDLIDNSVHSLIYKVDIDISEVLLGSKKVKRLNSEVSIKINKNTFAITDNCGGISATEAEKEVFRFGAKPEADKYTGLGLYGIGMKRAFFKMGKNISMISHKVDSQLFRVKIDVEKWKDKPEWDFEFAETPKQKPFSGYGTHIEVKNFLPGVGKQFDSEYFQNKLKEKISKTYSLFIEQGLKIFVNGKQLAPNIPKIITKTIEPVRMKFKHEKVDILLVLGCSAKEDKEPHGWYVFCNGRMVLEANKDFKTGWGVGKFPVFHYKYNHFIGFVYFRSADVNQLPWTTTKSSINMESPIYNQALDEMKLQARPFLKYINTWYTEDSEESALERQVLEKGKATPILDLPKKNTKFKVPKVSKSAINDGSIQYSRPIKKLDGVRKRLGKKSWSNKKIGEYTFDYFYKNECE